MTPAQLRILESPATCDLVEQVARSVHARRGDQNGLDLNDYCQIGMISLIEMIPLYDPARGPFENFARIRIHRRILDGIREADDVGRSRRADGIAGVTMSLDGPAFRGDERLSLLGCVLTGGGRRQEGLYEQLDGLLAGLPCEWRAVLYMSTIQELPAWQIGAALGLSVERVGEIREQALARLKAENPLLVGGMPAGKKRKESKRGKPQQRRTGRAEDEADGQLFTLHP